MITEYQRIAGKVIFRVTDTKGGLIAYRVFTQEDVGDSSKAQECESLHEARSKITITKLAENLNGLQIFKITDANNLPGTAKYLVRLDKHDDDGIVSIDVAPPVNTLTEARNLCGGLKRSPFNPSVMTRPKSDYVQNQPGYRAGGRAKKQV